MTDGFVRRYWTEAEHTRFLDALQIVGPKDVKGMASIVGTRNATQARTHAQKYFLKLARMKKCAEEALKSGSPGNIQETWLQHVSIAYARSGGLDSKRSSSKGTDASTTSRKLLPSDACQCVRRDSIIRRCVHSSESIISPLPVMKSVYEVFFEGHKSCMDSNVLEFRGV